MTATCIHGFAPDSCLICRALSTSGSTATQVAEPSPPKQGRVSPDRPEVIHTRPSAGVTRRRSLAGSLVVVLMALLALGAAAWILVGVVFTVLHVFELIAVGLGCGWVGYKIGHFRGSRHPH